MQRLNDLTLPNGSCLCEWIRCRSSIQRLMDSTLFAWACLSVIRTLTASSPKLLRMLHRTRLSLVRRWGLPKLALYSQYRSKSDLHQAHGQEDGPTRWILNVRRTTAIERAETPTSLLSDRILSLSHLSKPTRYAKPRRSAMPHLGLLLIYETNPANALNPYETHGRIDESSLSQSQHG